MRRAKDRHFHVIVRDGPFDRFIIDDEAAAFLAEIHLDRFELSQAGWYAREEIDIEYDDYSLTNDMMTAFKEGRWT